MNTIVEYMYRDASNYKTYETVIYEGELRSAEMVLVWAFLSEENHFLPGQVGMESLLGILGDGTITEDDHPWHELLSIESTEGRANAGDAKAWAAQFFDIVWDVDTAMDTLQ
jgi:hypothetical protein